MREVPVQQEFGLKLAGIRVKVAANNGTRPCG